MSVLRPVIFLPGGGGGDKELVAIQANAEVAQRFCITGYPGWHQHVAEGFSAESLISAVTAHIERLVPQGPIRIAGYSLGAHVGYATALRLQAMGREIAGFCAMDGVIKDPAMRRAFELIRQFQIGELFEATKLKMRNLMVRRGYRQLLPSGTNPTLDAEYTLIQWMAAGKPWIASLDRHPVALNAPAALLRTRISVADDALWRRRCPHIKIYELRGTHHTLLSPENIDSVREAFATATREWL